MSEKSVKLIECFNSFQGEGPDSGHPMMILRFKTCNRNCPWCDTSVKMRISMEAEYSINDLQRRIRQTHSGILVTGGEPTVTKHFNETVLLLNELDYPIANVETNGHRLYELIQHVDSTKPIKFMFSPKIFNEEDLKTAISITDMVVPNKNVFIKLVYEENDLLTEYMEYITEHHKLLTWDHRVWLMPEGTTRSDLMRNSEKVFDICEKYNLSFSSRNHIIFGFI